MQPTIYIPLLSPYIYMFDVTVTVTKYQSEYRIEHGSSAQMTGWVALAFFLIKGLHFNSVSCHFMDSDNAIEDSPAVTDHDDQHTSRKCPHNSLGSTAVATATVLTTSSSKKQKWLKGKDRQPDIPSPALQPISSVNPLVPKPTLHKPKAPLSEFKTISGSFTSYR